MTVLGGSVHVTTKVRRQHRLLALQGSETNGTVVVVNNNGETRKQRCRISDSTILQKSELTALREIQVDHLSDLPQLNDCIDATALLKRGLALAYVLDSAIRVRYRYS